MPKLSARVVDGMKVCRKCRQTKPLLEFTVDRKRRDGHGRWCCECRNRQRREARKQGKYWNTEKRYRENVAFNGLREQALTRDEHRCVMCKSEINLIIHHKDETGRSMGVVFHNNELDNLETVCRACHNVAHHLGKTRNKICQDSVNFPG